MNIEKIEAERKFLHDIASPISIARILVKMVIEDIDENQTTLAECKEKLEKIAEAVDKLTSMHAAHKDEITRLSKKAG